MIVPMKKARIAILKADYDVLFASLQRYGELMLIENDDTVIASEASEEQNWMQRAEKTLRLMKKHQEKKSFVRELYTVDYASFAEVDPKHQEVLERIEEIDDLITHTNNENHELKNDIKQLLPWQKCNLQLNQLEKTKYATIHIGYIEPNEQQHFIETMDEYGCDYAMFDKGQEGIAVLFNAYVEDTEAVVIALKNQGFIETSLPKRPLTVSELIVEKEKQIDDNLAFIESLQAELKELAKYDKEMQVLVDQMATQAALKRAHHQKTDEAIYIEGWVRSDRIERLEESIKRATEIYDLELTDPVDGEMPPTVTKNNRFTAPFETITDMFSKPRPYELDPNPFMAPWFWLIFGIMMGDAGYGLLIFLATFAFLKIKKPKGGARKLITVFMFSSITTMFWGILFGSYFGATWNPILFTPMDKPMEMLFLTLGLGAAHVITGILAKAYDNIRQKQYVDAICDQFSWVFILLGIGLLVVPALSTVGMIVAGIGVVLIVIFGGRKSKNIFGKIGGGVGSLYGITGYLSDILSYSRILALGLATGVIGMVMNMLAGMIQGNIIGFILSLFIYVIGHIFNIAMGMLSAYVHDSRLQYIEFFNKFYEGGGYEFKPLSIELKYVDAISDTQNI